MAHARVPLEVELVPTVRLPVDLIRLTRLLRGIGQPRVAACMGLTQSAWSRYERGERGEYVVTDLETARALADLLEARLVGVSRRDLARALAA